MVSKNQFHILVTAFLTLHSMKYAQLFNDKFERCNGPYYLVNTDCSVLGKECQLKQYACVLIMCFSSASWAY